MSKILLIATREPLGMGHFKMPISIHQNIDLSVYPTIAFERSYKTRISQKSCLQTLSLKTKVKIDLY